MASNLRESSAVGQVEPVGQTGVFRRPARGGTGAIYRSPVPPPPSPVSPAIPSRAGCPTATIRRKAKSPPEPWPPAEYALPDSSEGIEAGRQGQRRLFVEAPDDSRAGRVARILAGVPGVMTADQLILETMR